MSELAYQFSLHAAKFTGQVWVCLGVIWLVVLACAFTSIQAQPFSARQQKFWISVVVFVPILGVLAYLPFSFQREHLAQLFFIRLKQDRPKKAASTATGSGGGGPA